MIGLTSGFQYPHKDLLSTRQLSPDIVAHILETSRQMEEALRAGKREELSELLRRQIVALLFYEPSTRTMGSFSSAAFRLGADVIQVTGTGNTSLAKGETIHDNAQVIASQADCIVMRHPEAGSVDETARNITIPVINAGDGGNQHPTQALLDIYTILKERGTLENLHIAIAGDLKYGRTAHSLVYLLSLFPGMSFSFIAPPELQMPEEILAFLKERNISWEITEDYGTGIKNADVIYGTRVQEERFTDRSEYERLKDRFILTPKVLEHARPDITIMHPLPRKGELPRELDILPNAAYFRQVENGIPVRMTLLYMLLKERAHKTC